MGQCKCGAVLPGNRTTCDACKAGQAREAARRRTKRLRLEQQAAYTAAPKRCLRCGTVLPWEQRRANYCKACAYERLKERAKTRSAQMRDKRWEQQPTASGHAVCDVCGDALPEGRRRGLCEACQRRQTEKNALARRAKAREQARAALSKSPQGDWDTRPLQGTSANGPERPTRGNGLLLAAGRKALTLRQVLQLLERENAARKARGEGPLSYGRFVQEKGI